MAFKNHVDNLLKQAKDAKKVVVLTDSQPRIDDKFLKENVPAHADVYICGSLNFMQSMIDHFQVLEHKNDMIHYEPFGPKMSTVKV